MCPSCTCRVCPLVIAAVLYLSSLSCTHRVRPVLLVSVLYLSRLSCSYHVRPVLILSVLRCLSCPSCTYRARPVLTVPVMYVPCASCTYRIRPVLIVPILTDFFCKETPSWHVLEPFRLKCDDCGCYPSHSKNIGSAERSARPLTGVRSMSTSFFADAHVTVSAFGACPAVGIAIVSVFIWYAVAAKVVSAPSSRMTRILPGDAHGKTSQKKKRHVSDGQNGS